jgi:hypothetical protein
VLPLLAMAAPKLLPQAMGAMDSAGGPGAVAGAARKKFKYLFEPLVILIRSIINFVVRFVKAIPSFIVNLKILVASSVVLGIFAVVVLILLILLYYVHPRLLLPNRYANMDGFQERLTQDIMRCLTNVAAYGPPESLPGQYQGEASTLRNMGIPFISDANFPTKLDVFLKYLNTIQRARSGGIYARVGEATFKSAGLFLDQEGNYSEPMMLAFSKVFVEPLTKFRRALGAFKGKLVQDRVLLATSGVDPRLHTYMGAVMELDLLMNDYMIVALDNFGKRKASNGKLNFVIFERYYAPFVADMWKNGMKNAARAAVKMFVEIFVFCDMMWSKIGEFIGKIPCMLAPDFKNQCRSIEFKVKIGRIQSEYDMSTSLPGADKFTQPSDAIREKYRDAVTPLDKAAKQSDFMHTLLMVATFGRYRRKTARGIDKEMRELFGDDAQGQDIARVLERYDEPSPDDANPTDVVEHFGAVISLARTIGSFFRNFVPLGLQLVKYGKDFLKDPIMSIFGIISIIVGPIVGILLLIVYAIYSLPVFFGMSISWIWFFVIALVTTWAYFWLSFLFRVSLTMLMFFVFLGIWFVDFLTGGLIVKLMQCEDDPDAPEVRSNYVFGNVYQKGFLGCLYPCSNGFKPRPLYWLGNTPYLCARQEASAPAMCPQQQILRFFRGRALVRPYAFDMYKPGPIFFFRDLQLKANAIRVTYRKRRDFLNTCQDNLGGRFGPICRHVCSNVHNYQYGSSAEKGNLQMLCRQLFCEGPDYDAGVCAAIDNNKTEDAVAKQITDEGFTIFNKAFMVGIVAMIFIVIVLALIRASQKRATALAAAG